MNVLQKEVIPNKTK